MSRANPLHRGAAGDMALFAERFLDGRLAGFNKDMEICLRPAPGNAPSRPTHAYFPALGACCSTLEYLTALDRGSVRGIGWPQVAAWAEKYLPQPDYGRDVARVLFEAFRHPVAHRGIASGVWVDDRNNGGAIRRITWKVLANSRRPACQVLSESGVLVRDPPWPCPYTHRVHIHLRALWADIRGGAEKFKCAVRSDPAVLRNVERCFNQLYPR